MRVQTSRQSTRQPRHLPGYIPQPMSLRPHPKAFIRAAGASCTTTTTDRFPMPQSFLPKVVDTLVPMLPMQWYEREKGEEKTNLWFGRLSRVEETGIRFPFAWGGRQRVISAAPQQCSLLIWHQAQLYCPFKMVLE